MPKSLTEGAAPILLSLLGLSFRYIPNNNSNYDALTTGSTFLLSNLMDTYSLIIRVVLMLNPRFYGSLLLDRPQKL